jgi:hypothetical protein
VGDRDLPARSEPIASPGRTRVEVRVTCISGQPEASIRVS